MKKGISLVALIITIIVLIILTAAVVLTGVNTPQNAQLAVFYNNIATVQEAVNLKMLNNMSHYATGNLDLEKCKWVGVVKGYTEVNAQTNAIPEFNDATIKGINVSKIDNSINKVLSMDNEEFNKYYVDNRGVVYYEGFVYNGIEYYNRTITSATPATPTTPATPATPTTPEDKQLTGITITVEPTKVTYFEGEVFDPEGMEVTASYSNGTTSVILGYTITPSVELVLTDESVTILYTENGITKTAIQNIIVLPTTPTDIYVVLTNNGELLFSNNEIELNEYITDNTKTVTENYGNVKDSLGDDNQFLLDIKSPYYATLEPAHDRGITSIGIPWYDGGQNANVKKAIFINRIVLDDGNFPLFCECTNLSEIQNIDYLNVSNVTDMQYMFAYCSSLKELDLSEWDTSNAMDFSSMFQCSGLQSLNLSNWNTSNLTDMSGMFAYCWGLTEIDISGWDTSNVTDFNSIFAWCESLDELDLSNWDTSSAEYMNGMFAYCMGLRELELSSLFDTSNVKDMNFMFLYCFGLESLDVSGWNTSNVKDMHYMFLGNDLESLDVSEWDTSNVTNMYGMFSECNLISTLPISNWNTSNVTNMQCMFENCDMLKELDLSEWDTSSVEYMNGMFAYCPSLKELDLSEWDISSAEYISGMFSYCEALETLNLSGWNTSNVIGAAYMFSGVPAEAEIIVGSNWNLTKENTNFDGVFINAE